MPKIVGKSTRVVETDGFTIDEYAGNVGSNDDTMSLAVVKVSKPYSEPWLTLDYDEWIAVIKGKVDCHVMDEDTETKAVSAVAGETIFIEKGQRFKPVFPVPDTEYIPVCIPAFKPERCKREDEGRDKDEEKMITDRLKELHPQEPSSNSNKGAEKTNDTSDDYYNCTLYHMCEKSIWKAAVDSDAAYFPPTFQQDGLTHLTFVPEKLIETANHFYTSSKDDWICLKLCSAKTLKNKCGIVTIFEEPKSVGSTNPKDEWKDEVYPHIHGGIPVSIPAIVAEVYPMKRDPTNGVFLSITGLTD